MALLMDPDSCDAVDPFKGEHSDSVSHRVGDNCKANEPIAAIVQEYASHWMDSDYNAKVFFPDFTAAFQKLLSLGASKLQPEVQLLGARMTYHALKDCSAADECASEADCPNQFFPKCDTSVTPSQCKALT